MNIKIKLTGIYREHLPAGSIRGVAELPVAKNCSALEVITQLGMPDDGKYLTSLNGELLKIEERGSVVLKEGDRLAIMPPLSGG